MGEMGRPGVKGSEGGYVVGREEGTEGKGWGRDSESVGHAPEPTLRRNAGFDFLNCRNFSSMGLAMIFPSIVDKV